MDLSDILVAVFVPLLSFWAARGAQKQSARATQTTNETTLATATLSSRTDMETEAYVRARAMDMETIDRQASELKEMRNEVKEVKEMYDDIKRKYDILAEDHEKALDRIADLEKHERDAP